MIKLNRRIYYALNLLIWLGMQNISAKSRINWAPFTSPQTLVCAWQLFDQWVKNYKPTVDHAKFMDAVYWGYYETWSQRKLLRMKIGNNRLNQYPYPKRARDIYPRHDRPRREADISSVKYHATTNDVVSPIVVCKIITGNTTRLVLLDGAHRVAAAAIRGSRVKIFFVKV